MPPNHFDALFELVGPDPAGELTEEAPLVVVVDDDASVRDSLQGFFQGVYRVLTFETGPAAVEAISDDVAAVILDIKMKEHDGFWTCEAIRAKNQYLPVIFYSAYQDVKNPYELINQHRPFGYVVKSSNPSVLLDIVARAVKYSVTFVRVQKLIGRLQRA